MGDESLSRTQGWLQAAIQDPARTTGVCDVITASSTLGPEERLAIYQRGYRARLLECMRRHYPVLCHLLGRELFDAFAVEYLGANPSRSRTLGELGARFGDHLAATRPDRHAREEWIDLMIDIARFERAFIEVHAGPGMEDGALLQPPSLPEPLSPGWAHALATPAPSLRLLILSFPVHTYVTTVRHGKDAPPLPPRSSTHLVLSRHNYLVTVTEVEPPRWHLLTALATGHSLRQAALRAGVTDADATTYLREWVARRIFTAISLPEPVEPERTTERERSSVRDHHPGTGELPTRLAQREPAHHHRGPAV
ncbi:MAG: putative DNA-binding domain-containing protein [Pseudonocardiales bacterium]|nr:putative DNA-binding domain-containing protein [Pseudonocardiales bacterium]